MSGAVYNVGAREGGSRRHKLLGDGSLTTKRIHAIRFTSEAAAASAAAWLFDNNREEIHSTQVRDAETGRWSGRCGEGEGDRRSCRWLADLPRPAHAGLLRPALPWA